MEIRKKREKEVLREGQWKGSGLIERENIWRRERGVVGGWEKG